MTESPGTREPLVRRSSIVGRVWYPLVEERKSLAGVLSWLGVAILVAFLFIAIFADVLAPYSPFAFVDEKDVPPWSNTAIPRNETFTGWTGTWVSPSGAQSVNGIGARSLNPGDVVVYRGFTLRILRDAVEAVGLSVFVLANGTDPGHYLDAEVSPDGGTSWFAPIEVRTTGTLRRIDLTNQTTWSEANLTTSAFQVRLTHRSDGGLAGNLSVDFVGATAVWRSYWHAMGTDPLGRDVLSRVLHGTRTSLAIMAIGVSVALAVGFPLGLYSGYRGGNFDKVLVLVMDSLYSFPGLLFAGLIAVLLGKGVVNIGLAVTVIYIPLYFRVTRSQVLSAREELYVEAARALGTPPSRIMLRYIAANVIVAIPVIFSISAADAILTAAGLSFLGLGVEAPTPDWGLDLSAAAERVDNGIWWSSFFPGFVIVLLTVGLSFLGEGLNDIINPLLKKERS
jgi:peptide/nickel transport system permease protein